MNPQEIVLKACNKHESVEFARCSAKKQVQRLRSARYPAAPDPKNLGAINFSNTMFASFHVFTVTTEDGESITFLALPSGLKQVADAWGLLLDGTFRASACFGQLYVFHATVGPRINADKYDESYAMHQMKNFTRPVAYAFMSSRKTTDYVMLWETLRDVIKVKLNIDWKGPRWIVQDFERAQLNAFTTVS